MKLNRIPRCRSEQASALVIVLITAALCATLALGIVVNRNQSMKLAARRQQDELAGLDSRIQAGHVKGYLTQMVQNQKLTVNASTGTVDLSSPLASALGQVLGNGSVAIGEDGQSATAYAVAAVPSATPPSISLLQYTPSNAGSFQQSLTSDQTDPLWGIQAVNVVIPGTPIEIDATPAGADTVFYAGQRATNTYAFREVPLSIYSLYANGATTLSSGMVQGDAGRVYVNGTLTVNGAVNASRPLIAQGDIQGGANGAQLTVSQGAVQGNTTPSETVNPPQAGTVNQTGALPGTLQQMQYGNLVMGTGVEGRDVQVLPATNFNQLVDPNSNSGSTSTLSPQLQLGSQCEFRITYTSPVPANNVNGTAQVIDYGNGTTTPVTLSNSPGSFTDQVTQDSNAMNQPWDVASNNLPLPAGFRAALTANGTRLVNAANQPIQFIVFDYANISKLNLLQPINQTFYIPGDPTTQAVLLRGGAPTDGNGNPTGGGIMDGSGWSGKPGFSLVTNLDVYVYQGLAPNPNNTNNVAISLITSGIVHAVY